MFRIFSSSFDFYFALLIGGGTTPKGKIELFSPVEELEACVASKYHGK